MRLDRVEIASADITRLEVDAIVNAANGAMLGGGGVDGAIHRAAGPALREECRQVPQVKPGVRCPTGEARITGGHGLPAKHVIHTVGPVWQGGQGGEAGLLESCYRRSLQLAVDHDVRTVAFAAISCGVYGYPKDQAAAIAVRTVGTFLAEHPAVERVVLTAFDPDVRQALESARAAAQRETDRPEAGSSDRPAS